MVTSPHTTHPSGRRDVVTLLEAVGNAGGGVPRFAYDHSGQLERPLAVKYWFLKQGKVDSGLENPMYFRHHAREIDSLAAWFDVLRKVQRQPHMMRISGRLRPGAELIASRHGHLVMRRYIGEDAHFEGQSAGTHLLAIDIDNLEPPDWADFETPEGRADLVRWSVRETLPETFHEAEVVGQWSSSAGMKRDANGQWTKIKLHLWFWADRPLYCASIKEWSTNWEHVDSVLYHPVQPHHVAAPVFRDGLADPLPEDRTVYLHGDSLLAPPEILDRSGYVALLEERSRAANKKSKKRKKPDLRQGGAQERRARALLAARVALLDDIYAEQGGAHTACLRLAKWCFKLRSVLSEGEIKTTIFGPCIGLLMRAGDLVQDPKRNRTETKARKELDGYSTAIFPTALAATEPEPLPPEPEKSRTQQAIDEAKRRADEKAAHKAREDERRRQGEEAEGRRKAAEDAFFNDDPGDDSCIDLLTPEPPTPRQGNHRRVLDIDQPYFTKLEGGDWSEGAEDIFQYHWEMEVTRPRVIGLQGDKKTGKTLFLEKAVDLVKSDWETVCSHVSRRTLAYNTAPRLGLDNYLDCRAGEIDSRAVVVCLDSIHRIKVKDEDGKAIKFGLVILDEVEQLARHLMGGTIAGRSQLIFARFSTILRNAKAIIIADADLDGPGWALVREALGRDPEGYYDDELEVRNTYADPDRVDVYFDSKSQAIVEILNAVRNGQRVAVPCTYKRQSHALAVIASKYIEGEGIKGRRPPDKVEDIESLIASAKALRPGLRYLVVTSRTTSDKRVKAFLADPNGWLKENPLDLLIYSPTLGTGVSIETPFDRIIGIIHAGIHTVHDVMQMMARVRSVTRWEMWVESRTFNMTLDRDLIEKHYLDDIKSALSLAKRFGVGTTEYLSEDGHIRLQPTDPRHWRLFLTIEAARRKHKCNLLQSAVDHSYARGFRVERCPDTLTPDEHADVQMAMSIGGIHADEDEVAAVFGAQHITWGEAKSILERGARTRDEELAVHRARICHHLGRQITGNEVRLDVVDRLVSKTKRLAKIRILFNEATDDAAQIQAWLDDVIQLPEWDAGGDNDQATLDFFAAHTPDVVRTRALAKVLWLAGIRLEHLNGQTPYEMDHPCLIARRWPEKVQAFASTLEHARWGLTVPKNLAEAPMAYLKRCCEVVGLKLEFTSQPRLSNGLRVRVYSFEEEQRELAWAWSDKEQRRLAGLELGCNDLPGVNSPPFSPWPTDESVAQTGDLTKNNRGSVPASTQDPQRPSGALQGTLPLSPTSPTSANVTRTGHPPIGPP